MTIKGKKDKLDRFYTKDTVAQSCVDKVKYLLEEFKTIVEPSAGDGSFLRALKDYNVVGYDIAPEDSGIIKSDWFDVDVADKGKTCVIGNPPFGQRNSLSKAFIKHAISFDNVQMVAMVLPNSWNKPSLQNSTFPTQWRLISSTKLQEDSFRLKGEGSYKVPCTFQVWVRGDLTKDKSDLRWELKPPVTHKDFSFVGKSEADFFMMGAAPKVLKQPEDVNENNRGYYIKSNISPQLLRDRLTSIPWDDVGNATAGGGVYWISKPEFIKAYVNFIKENKC